MQITKTTQEEIENLSSPITGKEIESVIKKFPPNKIQRTDGFTN